MKIEYNLLHCESKDELYTMPYISSDWAHLIPEDRKGIMEFYPDIFLFNLNATQYTLRWQQLATSRYIYTDGADVRPTNWFMYAFQSVKGWLGFCNYCHPETVSYSLSKLAYYGYVNQYKQPDSSLMAAYPQLIPVLQLAARGYMDSTTAKLQSQLVAFFFKIESYLNIGSYFHKLPSDYRFGECWVNLGHLELIPRLDPQNESLIEHVIQHLEIKGVLAKNIEFIKNSTYAKTAAQYYSKKAVDASKSGFIKAIKSVLGMDSSAKYFEQALAYDQDIARHNVQEFIEHHLKKKEYGQAFKLLDLLSDAKIILGYLFKIPEIERYTLIKKDTPIARIMAQHYISENKYALAQGQYTNIEELSPVAAFVLAIQNKEHTNAYEIFKRHEKTIQFPKAKCDELAEIFSDLGEENYNQGKTCRDKKDWEKALQHYSSSFEQKKIAHHLNPSKEYLEDVQVHRRLYALVLIDADSDTRSAEQSDTVQIEKANVLLKECKPKEGKEQEFLAIAKAKGLMRRVDTLREKIAFTSYLHSDHSAINARRVECENQIKVFIQTLRELIELLTGAKNEGLRLKLGRAHYLLADVHEFFGMNDPHINHHYRMAANVVPENPFYLLRASEVFELEKDKFQEPGIKGVKKLGFSMFDFVHWSDERWAKKGKIKGSIKDIHEQLIESSNATQWGFKF